MDWLDILGWFLAFSVATSLFYKKGVKAGIRHALMILDLDSGQIEKLNKELKKDSYDLAMKAGKEYSKNKTLLN